MNFLGKQVEQKKNANSTDAITTRLIVFYMLAGGKLHLPLARM